MFLLFFIKAASVNCTVDSCNTDPVSNADDRFNTYPVIYADSRNTDLIIYTDMAVTLIL